MSITVSIQTANTQSGDYDVHRPMPFPFTVDETGIVQDPEILDETHARLLGFQNEADVHHIDLNWRDAADDLDQALNRFPVFVSNGRIWVYRLPVQRAELLGVQP